MFAYDAEVLKQEYRLLQERQSYPGPQGSANPGLKQLEPQLVNMIQKLENIQQLNDKAKRNEIYKE